MAELGLMGMFVPEAYGGAGMDYVSYVIAIEQLSRVCASHGVIASAHNSLVCYPILTYGTETQKRKYLVPLAKGETIGAYCLTEPNAGSNAANQQTTAILDGDAYVLNGTKLFVTNVLNGTLAANGQVVNLGTVTRLDLKVSTSAMPVLESISIIASGFPERTDPAALVIGPTGVALRAHCASDSDDCGEQGDDRDGARLYVADTLGNRIAVIDHPLGRTTSAGTGHTLSAGGSLNGPLGLIVTPRGELLTVNSGDGFITEISPGGAQRATVLLDNTGSPPTGAGTLFGLVFDSAHGVYFVDDGTNTVNLLH